MRKCRGMCTWRAFGSRNHTETFAWTYGLEVLMHEMLLQSEHRTFDPEAADFFYVPVYGSCFIFPLHCYADGPWWYAPSGGWGCCGMLEGSCFDCQCTMPMGARIWCMSGAASVVSRKWICRFCTRPLL